MGITEIDKNKANLMRRTQNLARTEVFRVADVFRMDLAPCESL
jgi:hypothetical protein